ncbi:MAG: hypothetical protein ACREJ2_00285, partial [Planctomycetota bacterium]
MLGPFPTCCRFLCAAGLMFAAVVLLPGGTGWSAGLAAADVAAADPATTTATAAVTAATPAAAATSTTAATAATA